MPITESTPLETQSRLAHGLAAILLTAGTLHFVIPKPFDAIVPPEIPADPRTLTYASGVAELAIGAALLPASTRRSAAAAAAALFVAVFPANVTMARQWWHKSTLHRSIAIARLPLQLPLIGAAVAVWRGQRKSTTT